MPDVSRANGAPYLVRATTQLGAGRSASMTISAAPAVVIAPCNVLQPSLLISYDNEIFDLFFS